MHRRTWIPVLLTLLAGALVWALVGPGTGRDRARAMGVALPGGETLRVLKASPGTAHEWVEGRWPFLDEVRKKLRWSRWLLGPRSERVKMGSARDSLCVFYAHDDALGRAVNPGLGIAATVDEHGCRIREGWGRNSWGLSGGRKINGEVLGAYPRRQGSFGVEFAWDSGASASNVIRVDVANPSPWRGTEWVPEPAPLRRELEGLGFVFQGWGGSGEWPWPRFTVEREGREIPGWLVREILFQDATGNHSQSPVLCRHEPAWKVEARFGREPGDLMDPEEAWDSGVHPIPPPGEPAVFEEERVLQGVRVRPMAFGNRGEYGYRLDAAQGWQLTLATNAVVDPGDGHGMVSSRVSGSGLVEATLRPIGPWLGAVVSGLKPDQRWDVVVEGADGRRWQSRAIHTLGSGFLVVSFDAPEDPGPVRLKWTVQRLRTVGFVVAPPAPPAPAR